MNILNKIPDKEVKKWRLKKIEEQLSKLKKILFEDIKKYEYIKNGGYGRIFCSVKKLSTLILGNEQLLDIGGSPKQIDLFSFENYITTVCHVNYYWINESKIDMRYEKLPFKDNSFDTIISWETIEHLWDIIPGGMLGARGIFNF